MNDDDFPFVVRDVNGSWVNAYRTRRDADVAIAMDSMGMSECFDAPFYVTEEHEAEPFDKSAAAIVVIAAVGCVLGLAFLWAGFLLGGC